jgi:hypothetical protein
MWLPRQLDIGQLPAPAMSMEPPRKGQPRDGRDHRKDVRYSSREATRSGVGVVQRRVVYELQAPQEHGHGDQQHQYG